MGTKRMPCNLTPEEKQEAWEAFDEVLTQEEDEAVTECLDQYLFYQTEERGRERDCICTHFNCGRFTVTKEEKPDFWKHKHGSLTSCPRCGEEVRMLAIGRMRTFRTLNDTKWKRITLCRTGKNGALLLMSGYVNRFFCYDDLRPVPEISWRARTYLMPGKRMQWFRVTYYGCGSCWGYHWKENEAVREPFNPGGFGAYGDYFLIGTDAIDRSALRYCQIEDWMMWRGGIGVTVESDPMRGAVNYLSTYTRYPAMEMAVKLELNTAVRDLVEDGKKNHAALNWDATTMQGFLRLNKQDAKVFFHEGGDLEVLAAYHTAKRANIIKNMMEFMAFLRGANAMGHAGALTGCAKKAGCTIQQAANYVKKISGTTDRVLISWGDYLDMAKQLQLDMSRMDVTMPKELQDRHDAAAETLSYRRKVEEQKKNKELNKRLRKMYEFAYGDLCVVVPECTEQIIMEGRTLKHCVGGYAARHFNDKVTILFLRHRRKPGTPFVTIEIVPRSKMQEKITVRQIHGYRNEGYLPRMAEDQKRKKRPEYKFKWFLDVWKEWVEAGSKRDKKGNPIFTDKKEKTA